MNEPVRILIIGDDRFDATRLVRELEQTGIVAEWSCVQTEAEFLVALVQSWQVILADVCLPSLKGFLVMDLLRERSLDIPFIPVSGQVDVEEAVGFLKRGACDFIPQNQWPRLGAAIRQAIEDRRLRLEEALAAEALRKNEERYRVFSEISSDSVYSLRVDENGDLRCEWITESFTRLTGFTSDEIKSRGWTSLYYAGDLARVEQHYEVVLSGKPQASELRILTNGQVALWICVSDRPMSVSGHVECIYGVLRDISVQKQLEEQVLRTSKMEAIGHLASGMTHDFNNILTVIRGYGELLAAQPELDGTSLEYVDELLQASRRASELSRQFLVFSRRKVLEFRNVNLNTILAGIETLLRHLVGTHLKFVISYGARLGLIRADAGQVEQVIMNLAINAKDAMRAGGILTIDTANADLTDHATLPAGSYVVLSVNDTGAGMDEETVTRAFEPFFTTKLEGQGTGLGLSLVYRIVKQSGGGIEVTTEKGRGTTFKIYLPRLEHGAEVAEEIPPFLLDPTRMEQAAKASETILVLESEGSVRSLVRQLLVRRGYEVLDTGDPAEAVQICERRNGKIDLLLTDGLTHGMNGPQLVEQAVKLHPEMKILFTSGQTAHELAPHGVDQNEASRPGVAFFEKPFTPDALARKIRDVIDGALGEEQLE